MHQKIQIGDFHIYADPEDGTGHLFCEQGMNYEPHITAELRRLIPTCKKFLDIGANVGFHTMMAKSIRRDVEIISIEAHPETARLLCRSVAECAIGGITIFPVALSDHNHVVQLDARFSNAVCGALRSWPFDAPGVCFAPCMTLDSLNLEDVDLVKMDIDGYEYYALQGAKRLIQARPKFIFEYHLGVISRSAIEGPELLKWFHYHGYWMRPLNPEFSDWRGGTPFELHKYLKDRGGIADIYAEHIYDSRE